MVYNDQKNIHSIDLNLGTELWHVKASGYPKSIAMTPSGSFVIAGTENGNIELYNDKGALNWSYSSNTDNKQNAEITAVALSKDGGLAAAGSNDGKVLLFNQFGNLLGSYQANDHIRSMTMSQDGSTVIAAGEKNIYAFSTGYKPSPASSPVSQNQTLGSLNTSSRNLTSPQNLTRQPVVPTRTKVAIPSTITELPTEYSIIKTSAKSPLSDLIPLSGILVAVVLLAWRRMK
jgi:outer membrane protein assembly factor BamB